MGTVWLLFIKPLFYIALQAFLSIFVLYRENYLSALPLLLDLEYSLKTGSEALAILQTKIIELCLLF